MSSEKCRNCQERTLCASCGQTQICFVVNDQCSVPKGRNLCLVCYCERCDHPTMCAVEGCEGRACDMRNNGCVVQKGGVCVVCKVSLPVG